MLFIHTAYSQNQTESVLEVTAQIGVMYLRREAFIPAFSFICLSLS